MKLELSFDLDNADFEPPNGRAIANAIHNAASQVEEAHDLAPGDGGQVRDANGNTVGRWEITDPDAPAGYVLRITTEAEHIADHVAEHGSQIVDGLAEQGFDASYEVDQV